MFERPIRVTDFDAVRVRLASPDDIRKWSHGEVVKPETINYRTQRPEKDGLFDERIFGPERDYECYCGKYKRVRYRGIVCDKCGVEVTRSAVRRERMGHIELASPVAHIWFLRGVPSRVGLSLDLPEQALERVVYFNGYIVTRVDEIARKAVVEAIEQEFKQKVKREKTKAAQVKLKSIKDQAIGAVGGLEKFKVLSEPEYFDLSLKYAEVFEAGTGAETIRKLLEELDFAKIEPEVVKLAAEASPQNRRRYLRRLRFIRGMRRAGIKPEWMILTSVPVLPPDLRPMVQLDGGRFATSDLNDLYRRVINRSNRLKHLQAIAAPEVIQRNEKRMLQESVDALIDNTMRKGQAAPAVGSARRPLKSLADMLRGKQGRFRQNLLGKRVDYSGRSVIVIGPEMALSECGLPKTMALELFKPFVMQKVLERELAFNLRGASHLIEEPTDEVWEILEEVIQDKFVLLNRAPTLHRLSVQAFKPVLVEGKAIQISPLVCQAFNADFDGDQMAVHVPISRAAQREASEIMLSSKNLLKPASGAPIIIPGKDIVLGCYILSRVESTDRETSPPTFADEEEAILAYTLGHLVLSQRILVRIATPVITSTLEFGSIIPKTKYPSLVETTVGRVLFNRTLPDDFPYVNGLLRAKDMERLISALYERYGRERTAQILDRITEIGFEYSTVGAVTWGMDDLTVPSGKTERIGQAKRDIDRILAQYNQGLLTHEERRIRSIQVWKAAVEDVSKSVPKSLSENGSVFTIVDAGARGSWSQTSQMSGMKGLVVNPAGQIMELPVLSSFKEGFNVLEYFISTHGARKGATDTALKTATAGYLTRRLVDVAQEIVVTAEDCGDRRGLTLLREDSEIIGQSMVPRVFGRIAAETIKEGRKVIVKEGESINAQIARAIEESKLSSVTVRSPLTCRTARGVCRYCYGWDLGLNELVNLGEAVGVIAAQAIGEPGTQLTMRTFHTGGVAAVSDITQGLPRVEELFEARPPKGQAVVSEQEGQVVKIQEMAREIILTIKSARPAKEIKSTKANKAQELQEYHVPRGIVLFVHKGDKVERGTPLTDGSIDLKDLYRIAGARDTERYITREVQRIYVQAGAVISDKHIEIIIRQMFSRVRVRDAGDSDLTTGEVVTKAFLEERAALVPKGKKAPEGVAIFLGITKASLATESFLSAASFQETARVLIQAAVDGMTDKLRGLKENIIIGRLVPVGTGFRREYMQEAEIGTVMSQPPSPSNSLETASAQTLSTPLE